MSRLQIVFFDGGGGHRQAATALKHVLDAQGRHETTLLNLQELLEPVDVVHAWTGVRMQDVYNGLLRRGWTFGAATMLKVTQAYIRSHAAIAFPLLEAHWRAERPDLVISVVPNLNRVIHESLTRACPDVPYVTILTDLADYPPHFWMEPEPQYFICGTPEAAHQAVLLGHERRNVFETSGMIVHPRFYESPLIMRAQERARMGLRPDTPTVLVCFGGEGSRAMVSIARTLDASGLDVQLILVCGRNRALAQRLERVDWRVPVHVEGFTTDMPYFMRMSDLFIGKPGPGSVSEALLMGLPVIVDSNAWTLPQERFNADWIRRRGYGTVVDDFAHIADAVRTLLSTEQFTRFRANVRRCSNRAVFEIPPLLDTILARGPAARQANSAA